MGKGSKIRLPANNNSGSSNGVAQGNGIMGSGVHGVVGSTVVCSASDTSMYCQLNKLVNSILMIALLCFIVWIVYSIFFAKKNGSPSRGKPLVSL